MRVLLGFVARMSAGYGSDADSVQAGGGALFAWGLRVPVRTETETFLYPTSDRLRDAQQTRTNSQRCRPALAAEEGRLPQAMPGNRH